jgi:hypothetical protein
MYQFELWSECGLITLSFKSILKYVIVNFLSQIGEWGRSAQTFPNRATWIQTAQEHVKLKKKSDQIFEYSSHRQLSTSPLIHHHTYFVFNKALQNA